jgi:hypothetical protein
LRDEAGETSTWKQLGSFDGIPPDTITFHPGGAELVVARDPETPGLPEPTWDPRPLRLVRVPAGDEAPDQPGGVPPGVLGPRSPVFSADGRLLAAAFDGGVGVWDTVAGASPRQWISLPHRYWR